MQFIPFVTPVTLYESLDDMANNEPYNFGRFIKFTTRERGANGSVNAVLVQLDYDDDRYIVELWDIDNCIFSKAEPVQTIISKR